ncbi:hypothetical protein L0657_22940 [Dyadobacter sp. CY345]|uniref:MoaF-related domain-containing protein n=1 Tax=Dyadobacter sp. CY345 TaxID=2909335 RepID=UPI001F18453C|nr:hypothetical protein [Dyadobacter sp. CY345]MCF2446831.1 hypothetical protein [Dyadobacter sp. CY345]
MDIIGNDYQLQFGNTRAILHYESESILHFLIKEIDGVEVNNSETVEVKLTQLRSQLFLVTWKDKNGNTVSQVQDYEFGIVYSNWTTPEGELKSLKGTISKI